MSGEWFATDDEDELDEAQQTVVSVLRARAGAAPWPLDPEDACLSLPGYVSYPHEFTSEAESYGRLLADTGQGLVESRIRTGGLGPPDRVVHVRGIAR